MAWYAFHGASAYVANVPTLADARAEAHDTGTTETGPYATQAAAQAVLGGHAPVGKPVKLPAGNSCGWFMVPPSTWQQILNGIEHIGNPLGSTEIAVPEYACGTKAQTLRNAGYQEYATKAQAENASTSANQNANPSASSLLGLPNLHNTRNLVIRTVKVVLGVALIIVGLVEIAKPGQVLSKLPPVIPV